MSIPLIYIIQKVYFYQMHNNIKQIYNLNNDYQLMKLYCDISFRYSKNKILNMLFTRKIHSKKLSSTPYYFEGRWWRLPISNSSRYVDIPNKIYLINDGVKTDITKLINELIGPNKDFHNHIITPRKLGGENILYNDTKLNIDDRISF